MSQGLYACAWAAEFPAQALLRLRTDWQTEPAVVLDGRAPEEWVCSLNRLATRMGAVAGMTRLEAESMPGLPPQRRGPVVGGPGLPPQRRGPVVPPQEARSGFLGTPVVGGPGLRLLRRSVESEAAARAVFLECATKFSPRIEDACAGEPCIGEPDADARWDGARPPAVCAFVLDIAGTERLFGLPAQFAERLRNELAASGFRASVAVSANYHAARMKAASIHGIAVIPEGAEAEALAKLPITALDLGEERTATFALWGIGTLGELAALPEAELVARVGAQAQRWRALARGEAEHTLTPIEAGFALDEFCEFETPVEQIDSLLFVGARMIDCLAARAAGRALALRELMAEMRLEGGGTHYVTIRPAVATTDRRFLLKLLQLEIGTHPPKAAVVSFALRAEAGQQSKVQLGLFAPQTPEPSRLDVTLARLRAMVGEERVGSPVLEDTHRTGGFHMDGFAIPDLKSGTLGTRKSGRQPVSESASQQVSDCIDTPSMALRRVRPARLVRVMLNPTLPASFTGKDAGRIGQRAMRPVAFSDGENRYEVAVAYGPWKTSGCWWDLDAWDVEEWDVLAVRAEMLPSGAKAPSHFAGATARLKSCPFKAFDSLVESGCGNDATVACLLTRDCARNAWQLEAFYD